MCDLPIGLNWEYAPDQTPALWIPSMQFFTLRLQLPLGKTLQRQSRKCSRQVLEICRD